MAYKTSVVDVLDRVIGLPTSGGGGAAFIPSDKFQGAKVDYVFRTSKEYGTGYHLDTATNNNGTASNTDNENHRDKKRARFDPTNNTTHTIPSRQSSKKKQQTGDELLAEAEQAQSQSSHTSKLLELTTRGINNASSTLQKTYQRNQLLRVQYIDDPTKFMMNELSLNDEIVSFKNVAVNISLYTTLVSSGVIDTLLSLMNHENSDICISILNVLVELFDIDLVLKENDDGDNGGEESLSLAERSKNMSMLVKSFVNGGGLDLLSSNLGRFDESIEEDAKGVEDGLSLVESLLDLERNGILQQQRQSDGDMEEEYVSIVKCICTQTTFISWLFQRIDKSDDDTSSDNETTTTATTTISPAVLKLHASEVLSTILQHEDYTMNKCGCKLSALPRYTSAFDDDDDEDKKPASKDNNKEEEKKEEDNNKTIDGIEILLLAIAAYRKSDPQIEVECELLENVFDILAASLLRDDNVIDFVNAEGIELMLRCIRQKVHSGGGALKVLNFALSGSSTSSDAYRTACETFVHAGGLKLLFPLYMGRKSTIPCPAACSEGGSSLAKKGSANNASKRAKRAAHARKKWLNEVEQNTINIMYALTRHIDTNSKYDAHSRILVKFVEEDCEKCDRTIELCLKYDEKARIAEYQYFRSDEAEEAESLGIDVDLAALAAKLRGGGDIFHRSCAILSFACVGSKRCRGHVLDQLKLQGSGMSVIKAGLTEFSSLLSDGDQKLQIEQYTNEI